MNPAGRWTVGELLFHHMPFAVTVFLAFWLLEDDQLSYWIRPLAISLLTALNEASLIGVSLGAPKWVVKARRLYGFGIVLFLAFAELVGIVQATWAAVLQGKASPPLLLITALVTCAFGYHIDLLARYISSWRKPKSDT